MKLTIKKEHLVNALDLVTPITDKSSSKPILSNFLLQAEGGKKDGTVDVSATDYEISLKGSYAADIEEPGSICISAKKALDVCREFMAEDIRIQSDSQLWVTLEGGPARLRLPSVETGLYPQMEKQDLPNGFTLNAKALSRYLELTVFATQMTETRKNLTGVCLNVQAGGLSKWTATDGHRLAQVTQTLTGLRGESPPEIIVPRRAIVEMEKVLGNTEGDVDLSFDARSLTLKTNGVVLSTRLVEGKFPNVDQVIPKDSERTLTVNRERFMTGLRIVSYMSPEKIKPVKLSLTSGKLRLSTERSEYGDVTDEMEVEYEGGEFHAGFNARYLLDVLAVATHGESVVLGMKGALHPCLIRVPNDESFLAVVMPLRIEW
jgi:DNA polymerase III subunit beta